MGPEESHHIQDTFLPDFLFPDTAIPDPDDILESLLEAADSLLDSLGDSAPAPSEKMPEYDLDGNRRRIGLDADPTLRRESPRRTLQRIGRESAALDQIKTLPGPGEELILILTGRWHGFDLVGAVLQLIEPLTIHRLGIATLGFNSTQTRALADMLDAGRIGSIDFLVSEMFKEHNQSEFQLLADELTARGQTLAAARNHAKLMLFELSDGTTLAAHGSLNLRRCNSFEQLAITTDPAVHSFFTDFIADASNGLHV